MDIPSDVDNIGRIAIIPTLLEVICQTSGMGFAAVARVTENKWVACSLLDKIEFGLMPGGELKLETTICNEIQEHREAVVIDHVEKDARYSRHPTPLMYGFQSYISVPIFRKEGDFFGTLCAIDPLPHRLNTPEIIGMFNLFADLISFHLQSVEQISLVESKLKEAQKTSELREQFIAIMGHDLRNPLNAISMSTELLGEMTLDSDAASMINIIGKSTRRMTGLINNVMDFASGRMGGGIHLNFNNREPLEEALLHIITELRTSNPAILIEGYFQLDVPVICDTNRISELLSNLLCNAVAYGDGQAPIHVHAKSNDQNFTLSVSNSGAKIPENILPGLFEPFARGVMKPGREGLGLGLYIVAEIARAHGGTIKVNSTDEETQFILTIPMV